VLLTIGLCLTILGQDVLPGSNLSLRQAKDEARVIVAAEVVETGDTIGNGAYILMSGLELKPSGVYKGKVKDEELEDVYLQASGPERLPKKREEFLFFMIESKGRSRVLKMLSKTKENLKEIQGP